MPDDFFDKVKAAEVFAEFNAKVKQAVAKWSKFAPNSIVGCLGIITPRDVCASFDCKYDMRIDQPPSVDYGSWHCSPEEMYAFIQIMNDSLAWHPSTPFSFVELGAGWGPWTLNAMRYLQVCRDLSDEDKLYPSSFVAVEAMRAHCYGLIQHAATNQFGLTPNLLHIRNTAVVSQEHKGPYAWFPTSEKPDTDWGQSVKSTQSPGCVRVEACKLSEILNTPIGMYPAWVVHSDIQGDEVQIFTEDPFTLRTRVANVIIGTHSAQGHDRLFTHFLSVLGWQLIVSKSPILNADVQEDGVLAFRNPAFTRS